MAADLGSDAAMKLSAYATLSSLLAAGVVGHAVMTRRQFYPAVIYLATSKFSILVTDHWPSACPAAPTSADPPNGRCSAT